MPRYYTVMPLLSVPQPGAPVALGAGLTLASVPPWLTDPGQALIDRLAHDDRQRLAQSVAAVACEYDAEAWGQPDPAFQGIGARSIQESKREQCAFAGVSLWLTKPSPATHFLSVDAVRFDQERPTVQHLTTHNRLACHQVDADTVVVEADFAEMARIHALLLGLDRGGVVFTAAMSILLALQTTRTELRLAALWLGIEALFGADDAREITYRMSHRLAFFLGQSKEESRALFKETKDGYAIRSKVVHGRWNGRVAREKVSKYVSTAEGLARRGLVAVLSKPGALAEFSTRRREDYLDGFAFK
jgi:hypothetical protein